MSVIFPRQRVWPILPGVRSFLNFAGMSKARSGICRSPITRTRRDVILNTVVVVSRSKGGLADDIERCGEYLGQVRQQ